MNSTARRFTAFALTAGPVLTLVGMATTPWEEVATTASYQQSLLAHPTQAQVAAVLLIFGYALMGLTWSTILFHARHTAPKALLVPAAIFAFLGATILPGIVTSDPYDLALAQTLPAADAIRASDQSHSYAIAVVPMAASLGGMLFGSILTAFAGWRGNVAGAWLPAAVVLAIGASVPLHSGPFMIATAAVLAVAYALVARRLLARSAAPVSARAVSEVSAPPPEPYDPARWRAGSSSSAGSTSATATASRCPASVKS